MTGIFCWREQKPARETIYFDRDRKAGKSRPDIPAETAVSDRRAFPGDRSANCLVVESLSDTQIRSGNFRRRDRERNGHSRRLPGQRPCQPENLADMSLTSRRYCECLILHPTESGRWWRRQSCETGLHVNNRDFLEYCGQEQASGRPRAADRSKFHHDLCRLNSHPGNSC